MMAPVNILSDDRIRLRAVEPTDVDLIMSWENDETLWTEGNTVAPFSRKAIWDYVENYNPDIYTEKQLRLMVVDRQSEQAVGMIDLFEFDAHNRRCGIGLMIGGEYRGMGYGKATLELMKKYVRHFLGLHQLWAYISVDNINSIELFKECGFKICGRLRSWLRRNNRYTDVFIVQSLSE